MKNILVTGGAGFIGSHTVRKLKEAGYNPIIFDNLSNGHKEAVRGFDFVKGDIQDRKILIKAIKNKRIDGVIHFAGFIEVGESVKDPQKYYQNNILGSLNLINVCKEEGVKKFVFSSSAAVYGNPLRIPIDENDPKIPTNPYGFTKLAIEEILKDYDRAYGVKSVSLRYFNASGASLEDNIGEDHNPETHLVPRIIKYGLGQIKDFKVYGKDYKTKDGTCVRDYVHVNDLAEAHVLALKFLDKNKTSEFFNLGSEEGFSVSEVIKATENILGKKIKYQVGPRREGDPDTLLASNKKARKVLGWKPQESSIENIVTTALAWHQNKPKGFK
jgi:UDP-glucose 4-epimerase